MTQKIKVAGIDISCFSSIDEVIDREIITPSGIKSGIAIAINPEKIICARKNQQLSKLIEQAQLKYPDGIGVSYVMSKKSNSKIVRIPGCELWERLMLKSRQTDIPVFLVGAVENVLQKTKKKLLSKNVNIVGAVNGYFSREDELNIIHKIQLSGAKIVCVGLGSPKQELFMQKCKKLMPDCFIMGVGGTYDVYTGNIKRAPNIFIKFHCEWLYRLLSQPTRINRQINLLKYALLYLVKKL